jgi:hypothetical protein
MPMKHGGAGLDAVLNNDKDMAAYICLRRYFLQERYTIVFG